MITVPEDRETAEIRGEIRTAETAGAAEEAEFSLCAAGELSACADDQLVHAHDERRVQ